MHGPGVDKRVRWPGSARGSVFCLTLVGWLAAIDSGVRAQPPALAVEDYQLSNGLRVVLAPDPLIPEPILAVIYAGGGALDPPSHRGLAHLVEHLTFRGSRHLQPLESDEILARAGAAWDAYTALDRTVYLTQLPEHALPVALWIESERMGFALDGIDREALELERRIVINELAERGAGLSRQLWQRGLQLLYGEEHPFAPQLDEAEHVRAVTLPEVQWFFQSSYRPDNAMLVITGRFEARAAREQVEKYFAPIRSAPLPRLSRDGAPPKLCGVRAVELGHPFLFGKRLQLIWALPAGLGPAQRAALEAVRSSLAGRLEERLVWTDATASWVEVSTSAFHSHGLFSIEVELHEAREWQLAEAPILEAVASVSSQPIEARELRALRTRLLSRSAFARDHGVERALALADGRDLSAEQAALEALDGAALLAAARPLRAPYFKLRAKPSVRAGERTLVLRDAGGCP